MQRSLPGERWERHREKHGPMPLVLKVHGMSGEWERSRGQKCGVKCDEMEIRLGRGLGPLKVQPTHTHQGPPSRKGSSSTYRVKTNLISKPAPSPAKIGVWEGFNFPVQWTGSYLPGLNGAYVGHSKESSQHSVVTLHTRFFPSWWGGAPRALGSPGETWNGPGLMERRDREPDVSQD